MSQINIFTYSLKSDVFIHDELRVLSKGYEKINLFTTIKNSKEDVFSLPENIIVHELLSLSKGKRTPLLFLKALLLELIHGKNALQYLLKPRFYFAYFNNAYNKALSLSNYFENSKIDKSAICYTYWFDDWTFALSILKSEGKIGKLVTRIHGGDVYEYQQKEKNFFFPFRNFQITQLNRIYGISKDGIEHIKKKYSKCKGKLELSRLGTCDYGLNSENKESDQFVILSCSSFYHFKNVGLIPKILSQLNFKVKWIHIGGEGPEKEIVLEDAKKLPANIQTEFKGQMEHRLIFEFYKRNKIDLFLNTSISEGLPVSLMEAISFGIPIMAPNIGGIKEIVNDETGILFELYTPEKILAERITKVFKKETIFVKNKVREFWDKNYNAQNNHSLFLKSLQAI